MDLSSLSPRKRESLGRVLEYIKSNPDTSMLQAYKACGVNSSTIHSASVALGFKGVRELINGGLPSNNAEVVTYPAEKKSRGKYNKPTLKTGSVGGNAYVVIIPRSELSQTLNELMKG